MILVLSLFVIFGFSNLFRKFPLHDGLSNLIDVSRRSVEDTEAVEYIEVAKDAIEESYFQRVHELTTDSIDPYREDEDSTTEQSLYHNYDSDAYVIVGTADVSFLNSILEKDNYLPIGLGNSLEGVVMIWMRDRKDTTLGEEIELQVSVLASPKQFGYLGVSYDGVNPASALFPFFGKLEHHNRLYVFHRSTNNEHSDRFGREVFGMPGEVHQASLSVGPDKSGERDGKFLDFEFKKAKNERLVMKGKFKIDESWGHWGKTTYQIFRAVGLSGILDLWYAPHVTHKKISPIKDIKDGLLTPVHTDFRKQRFYMIDEQYDLEFGVHSAVGRELKVMKFKPKMIVKTENLQEAFVVPKKQSEDMDFLTTELNWEKRNGVPVE